MYQTARDPALPAPTRRAVPAEAGGRTGRTRRPATTFDLGSPPRCRWQAGTSDAALQRSALALQRSGGNRRVARLLGGARSPAVQRADDDGWVGSLFDTVSDAIGGAAEAIGDVVSDVGERIGTALDLASYPSSAAIKGPVTPPDTDAWSTNEALAAIRHGDGEALSRTSVPTGGDRGATKLLKQALRAWGCDTLGLDLLPTHGTGGYFGPETAAAVKQVQLFAGLSTDGVLGPMTLGALDRYLGVRLLAPRDAAEQGESVFEPTADPMANIYFATDSAVLTDDDEKALARVALQFLTAKHVLLNVRGVADWRHDETHNLLLGSRRAEAARDRLVELFAEFGVVGGVTFDSIGEHEIPQYGTTAKELKMWRRADVSVATVDWGGPEPPPTCPDTTGTTTEWEMVLRNLNFVDTPGPVMGLVYVLTLTGEAEVRVREPDSNGCVLTMRYRLSAEGGNSSFRTTPCHQKGRAAEIAPHAFTTTAPVQIRHFGGIIHYDASEVIPGSGPTHKLVFKGPADHGADVVEIPFEHEDLPTCAQQAPGRARPLKPGPRPT